MSSPSRTRISRMRPATLAATAESSPSTRPVSSTMLDGVDGPAKNSRQTTRPTIARAATAITGATFLLDAAWLESDASAARSSAILVSPSLPTPDYEYTGFSSSYFRKRPYNWVRDTPRRWAALDLFHPD